MAISAREDRATALAWASVGGAEGAAARVGYRGAGALGGGRLPVRELARATVGACSLAAAELAAVRAGGGVDDVAPLVVDEGAVSAAFVSERHLLVNGRAPVVFAPLSGFWRTADGWVRTHANYPHHREALVRALGLPSGGSREATPEELRAALAARGAVEVQEAVYAAGGLAVAVTRTYGDPLPLVERWDGAARGRRLGPGALPASGVRVLDLTRVIAGPVATRTLGLLGADVLRIDSPRLAEADDAHADTGFGKRSALLDLGAAGDRAVFERLLAEADVVVTGYRPGALDRYGLSAEELMQRRPGVVVAQLCAWGWSGAWAGRRGFDSLVQAGYGIAAREAGADGVPGALPAQALDHGTGYLVAAGVLRALADGGGRGLRYSLAGTGSWLVRDVGGGSGDGVGGSGEGSGYDAGAWLREGGSGYGWLRHAVSPVGEALGVAGGWGRGPSRWGADGAAWVR
ncbi:CoA transferase [Streptomyces sp. NPDC002138]|uniref:CoA transferase n=1 Tax=Streptomyces sp. NPDC002138 TaxID=3154410 RepID=UPI0033307F52